MYHNRYKKIYLLYKHLGTRIYFFSTHVHHLFNVFKIQAMRAAYNGIRRVPDTRKRKRR